MTTTNDPLHIKANKHVKTIVTDIFEVKNTDRAMIVFDKESSLAKLLARAYQEVLPQAQMVEFASDHQEEILHELNTLEPQDFVALVQTSSFRLNAFRLRVELFKKGLKVIEHPHLGRMKTLEDEETYIDALAYDKGYYRETGKLLKERIDKAKKIIVECGEHALTYEGPFEDAKLNVGDYRNMKNWGGQFPIGEVFTEPKDLTNVNGTATLIAFGDQDFLTNVPDVPITITVKNGEIVDVQQSSPTFEKVLKEIREEEVAVLRELGFGMNRAMSEIKTVPDIGTFERMCGIHVSLGGKHTIYAKEQFSKKHSRFHVDVFLGVTKVWIDDTLVFADGKYQ